MQIIILLLDSDLLHQFYKMMDIKYLIHQRNILIWIKTASLMILSKNYHISQEKYIYIFKKINSQTKWINQPTNVFYYWNWFFFYKKIFNISFDRSFLINIKEVCFFCLFNTSYLAWSVSCSKERTDFIYSQELWIVIIFNKQ